MQRLTLNSFLLLIFIISSPLIVLAQFYPSKISNKTATQKADSIYFEYIKNTLKVKQAEIPSIKFDEINKTNAIEIADSKYSEWLKKSSEAKQIEIPALKFNEIDKISALEIADSKYFEYIKIAEKDNNNQRDFASSKFDEINKISAVEIADSKYYKTPLIINQDLNVLESLVAESKLLNNNINTKSKQESLSENIVSDEITKKQFSNKEKYLVQQQSIESEIIQNSETPNLKESKESLASESMLINNEINTKTKPEAKTIQNPETLIPTDSNYTINKSNTKINTNNNAKWKTDIQVTEEQAENIKNGFYIVNEGETLYRVSVNTKLSVNKLKILNNLKNNNINPGSKLIISYSKKSKKGLSSNKNISKWKTDIQVTEEQAENINNGFYIVNEGETLYRVSVNTKLSVDKIKSLNNLKNNNVYPGTKLIIK